MTPNMTIKRRREMTSERDIIDMSTYHGDSEAPSHFSKGRSSRTELWTSDGAPINAPSITEASSRENLGPIQSLLRMGLSPQALKGLIWFGILMVFPFIGQWLFWAGFIGMAKDL